VEIYVRDIYSLPSGSTFEGYFVIESIELKRHRTGEPYLRLVLSDRTGTVNALWWKPPKGEDLSRFKKGDVVFVKGYSETYQGNVQPKITSMRIASGEEFSPDRFVVRSKYDIEEQFIRLLEKVESVKNPFLRKLLNVFFEDDEFVELFLKAPGGKIVHHSSIGGLLEHTLGVIEICEVISRRYRSIDRDLLLSAAILHDIGKVREYEIKVSIDRTLEGLLLGHLFMGADMVSRAIEGIDGFPEELKVKLLHCILAHHGRYEYGSPKRPKTLEAVALAYADALDSKVKGFEEHIERELGEKKGWTKRHFAFEVPIYFDGEMNYEEEG